MKVLVINSGSSSLKYQLISMPNGDLLAKGLVDRIAIDGGIIKHYGNGNKTEVVGDLADHNQALTKVFELLLDAEFGVLKSLDEIDAIGHRVVHGGEDFVSSVEINDIVRDKIEELIELAPLHNPANLMGIDAVKSILPNVPNVAVFDTSFHQTMEASHYVYSIPYKYYEKHKIRRYGFHGTSHKYVSNRAAEILNKDISGLKVVTCHIGNGASIAAIDSGKVVDTSMGFTPLEGLTMGTRSGDLDPAIIPFLMKKEGLSIDEIDNVLNKKSGVLGISGVSSDMRDIEAGHISGSPMESLALDIYVNKIIKYIGSYVAVLGGCDILVFTAGTLENSIYIRKMIVDKLGRLGVKLDENANDFRGEERVISTSDSKTTVIVVPTNEEYMIAKEVYDILN